MKNTDKDWISPLFICVHLVHLRLNFLIFQEQGKEREKKGESGRKKGIDKEKERKREGGNEEER